MKEIYSIHKKDENASLGDLVTWVKADSEYEAVTVLKCVADAYGEDMWLISEHTSFIACYDIDSGGPEVLERMSSDEVKRLEAKQRKIARATFRDVIHETAYGRKIA